MPKDPAAQPAEDGGRREALKTLARFAIYVAPAMTVLVRGAKAHHKAGHCRGSPSGQECVSPA